jgi:TolA-binding protein
MVVGFVVFFLFFFVRGFVQQRQRQRVEKLQRDIDQMRQDVARWQLQQQERR